MYIYIYICNIKVHLALQRHGKQSPAIAKDEAWGVFKMSRPLYVCFLPGASY